MNYIWISSFIADVAFAWLYFRKSELTPGKRRLWLKILLSLMLFHLYSNYLMPIEGAPLRVVYRALLYFVWLCLSEGIPWKGALYSALFWVGVYTAFQNIFFGPFLGNIFTGRADILQSHLWSQLLLCVINVAIRALYFGIIATLLPLSGMIGADLPNIFFVILINVILIYSKGTVLSNDASFEGSPSQFEAYFVLLQAALLLALLVFEYSRRKTVRAAVLDIQNTEARSLIEAVQGRQQSEDAIRSLRHDLKNHAVSMKLMLDNGDTDGAKKYLNAFLDAAANPVDNYRTGSDLLDGLLKLKLAPAKDDGVDVSCSLDFSRAAGTVDNFDLCILMGNVLDNAVEACSEMPKTSDRFIKISGGPAANCQLIKVDNSSVYANSSSVTAGHSSADHSGAVSLPATTKADKTLHGFGLRNVKKVLDRYSGSMMINHENGCYSISMLIPIKESLSDQ